MPCVRALPPALAGMDDGPTFVFLWIPILPPWRLVIDCSDRCAGSAHSTRTFPPDADQVVVTIPAAISGHSRKLLTVPLDRDQRSHRDRSPYSQACPRFGGVFQRRRYPAGSAAGVLPRNLGYGPLHHGRFDFTPIHAGFIGYGGIGVQLLRCAKNGKHMR